MHNFIPSAQDTIAFCVALVTGSGLGCLFVKYHIRNEAKAALAEDISAIHEHLETLDKKASDIEHDYVQCRFCDMQYNSVHSLLNSMDSKINILLEKQLH